MNISFMFLYKVKSKRNCFRRNIFQFLNCFSIKGFCCDVVLAWSRWFSEEIVEWWKKKKKFQNTSTKQSLKLSTFAVDIKLEASPLFMSMYRVFPTFYEWKCFLYMSHIFVAFHIHDRGLTSKQLNREDESKMCKVWNLRISFIIFHENASVSLYNDIWVNTRMMSKLLCK